MYAYIKGTVIKNTLDFLVIDNNGIGYKIFSALSTLDKCKNIGSEAKLYTYLKVREDDMTLYGFLTEEELHVFELLLGISGVGPKAAVSIISNVPVHQFGLAVISEDFKVFTAAQGIGKKTAQRIILELKDKLKKEDIISSTASVNSSVAPSLDNSVSAEACSALVMLGYKTQEAKLAISNVYEDGITVEEIIRKALKNMAK